VDSWFVCSICGNKISLADYKASLYVCPGCGRHSRLSWQDRLDCTADEGSFREFDAGVVSANPIGFPGYEEKTAALRETCGAGESIVTGICTIMGYRVLAGVMDSRFMMASMGCAAGEKITRLFEYGTENRLPVVIFTASGGARMQEGIFSLMQMAKTSGALGKHSRLGQLYVSVLTDPTTGGVMASFASLGDIIIAEPGALAGFAGKRVIRDTIGGELPFDFQSAEFVSRHGFVDMIVERKNMRETLAKIFRVHRCKKEL
jgi:acetyl-CoA carboxylase carboxyl transferase subunit beta